MRRRGLECAFVVPAGAFSFGNGISLTVLVFTAWVRGGCLPRGRLGTARVVDLLSVPEVRQAVAAAVQRRLLRWSQGLFGVDHWGQRRSATGVHASS